MYAARMNDRIMKLTLVGTGEPLLRIQKRLGCAATELGVTLHLDIERHPEAVGLRYEQTPAVLAQGRCLVSGLPRTEEIVTILRALSETETGVQP
jgi:hypothetical protein